MSAAAQLAEAKLAITRWPNLTGVRGTVDTLASSDLYALLRTPRKFAGKDRAPGFSPAEFDPPDRELVNVRAVTLLMLDYDDQSKATIDAAKKCWASQAGFLHTTKRHTEDVHRFRVGLWLSRSITKEEHTEVWRWLDGRARDAGHMLDQQAKDASRFWYLPATTDGSPHHFEELDGELLDVERVLAEQAAADDAARRRDQGWQPAPVRQTSTPDVMSRASAYLATMPEAISGAGGHSALWLAVLAVVRGFDLSEQQALDLLWAEYNPRCQPRWSRREMMHKVKQAATRARVPRGYLRDAEFAGRPTMTSVALTAERQHIRGHDKARDVDGVVMSRLEDNAEKWAYDDATLEAAANVYASNRVVYERIVGLVKGNVRLRSWEAEVKERARKRQRQTAEQARPVWEGMLIRNQHGSVKAATANVVTVLAHDPGWKSVLTWNDFTGQPETTRRPPWRDEKVDAGTWTEADDVRLVMALERRYGVVISASTVRAAVVNVARRRSYHPVRDWLSGVEWDRTPRLSSWMRTYLGSKQPDAYIERVGTWSLIAAVARVYRPGCKADCMVVLEGPQGAMKSTALRVLAGDDNFATLSPTVGDKDAYLALQGAWLVELDELAGLRRAAVEKIKSFLSSQADRYRPPYARAVDSFPRQCMLWGTTNADAYLTDHTGGRRFWPVEVGQIDIDGLRRDRDQLWAEAVVAFWNGKRWWPERGDAVVFAEEADLRFDVDAWEPKVAAYIATRNQVTMPELLNNVVNKPMSEWTRGDQMRVGQVMKHLKWVRRQRREGGKRIYFYEPSPLSLPVTTSNEEVVTPKK